MDRNKINLIFKKINNKETLMLGLAEPCFKNPHMTIGDLFLELGGEIRDLKQQVEEAQIHF
jgi:hypothetical protein